jgi:hypothetical protein
MAAWKAATEAERKWIVGLINERLLQVPDDGRIAEVLEIIKADIADATQEK